MFGSKNRRIADLEQRNADLHEQLAEARHDAAAHLGASKRTAARNVHLGEQLEAARHTAVTATRRTQQLDGEFEEMADRLERLLRGCVRYRRDLAEQHRVIRRLTDQLFDSMGYDDAGLKRLEVAVPVGREPGLVEGATA